MLHDVDRPSVTFSTVIAHSYKAQAYFLVFFDRFNRRKQTTIGVMIVCRLKGLSISRIGHN